MARTKFESRVRDDATHIVHWTLSTEEDCDQTKLEPSPKDKLAEEIPQYTIKTAVISDKCSKRSSENKWLRWLQQLQLKTVHALLLQVTTV